MIFQAFHLFLLLTVMENVCFPPGAVQGCAQGRKAVCGIPAGRRGHYGGTDVVLRMKDGKLREVYTITGCMISVKACQEAPLSLLSFPFVCRTSFSSSEAAILSDASCRFRTQIFLFGIGGSIVSIVRCSIFSCSKNTLGTNPIPKPDFTMGKIWSAVAASTSGENDNPML